MESGPVPATNSVYSASGGGQQPSHRPGDARERRISRIPHRRREREHILVSHRSSASRPSGAQAVAERYSGKLVIFSRWGSGRFPGGVADAVGDWDLWSSGASRATSHCGHPHADDQRWELPKDLQQARSRVKACWPHREPAPWSPQPLLDSPSMPEHNHGRENSIRFEYGVLATDGRFVGLDRPKWPDRSPAW